MTQSVLGIIGGSGLYDMPALKKRALGGDRVAVRRCLRRAVRRARRAAGPLPAAPRPRPPHPAAAINYRANIDALKRAGVTDLVSVSAVGSLQEELPPGHFVIVDQFIDRTFAREKSFFGTGWWRTCRMADPVCARLADAARGGAAATRASRPRAAAPTSCMEGPQFSTRAEIATSTAPGAATSSA